MKKFVLDVNVWVSVFYRDRQSYIISLIQDEQIDIFSNEENIAEFADVHTNHKKIAKLLPLHTSVYVETMEEMSKMYVAQKRYALLADYKDNYLIDLAHQTHSILVTNDNHFGIAKKLKSPKVKIITLAEFYQMLNL